MTQSATVDKNGRLMLINTPAKAGAPAAVPTSATASAPATSGLLNLQPATLAGLAVSGVSDALTAEQAVAAQSGLLAKFETALSAVFDFVPPLVAVADPAAGALVSGIGQGVGLILQAVRTHAANTTAVPGAAPTSQAEPVTDLSPAPAAATVPTPAPSSPLGTSQISGTSTASAEPAAHQAGPATD